MAAVPPQQQQVEQWIFQSSEPGVHQRRAVELLQQWTAQSSAEAVAFVLFQLLQHSGYPAVQFYALSTLQRLALSETQRSQLRNYLLYQFPSRSQIPTYLRNKAASLLAAYLVRDAAVAWTTVESDLLQLAASSPGLFLQTLIAVLDCFSIVSAAADDGEQHHSDHTAVSVSVAASTVTVDQTRRFKDVLKGYHNEQGTAAVAGSSDPTLLKILFGAVTQAVEAALSQESSEELQVLALRTVTGFFQWTTDSFLGDTVPRCLELLLFSIQAGIRPAVCKASLQALQEWVTSCSTTDGSDTNGAAALASSIQSISDPKLPIFSKLLERIHESNMLPATIPHDVSTSTDSIDAETMEVIIQISVVVNSAALELLPLCEQQVLSQMGSRNVAVETLFHQVLDLFFRAFAYDDIDVATAVLPFATRLSIFMEEDESCSDGKTTSTAAMSMRQHTPLVLNTLYNQMKYPVDFQYDYEDEDDAEEEVFRTELCKVYGKLVRVAPLTCLQFVSEAASAHLTDGDAASVPTADIMATLRLLFHYCESIRPPPGLTVVMRNETFCAVLKALHTSNIAQHPHREVVCLYYDTAVRYYPIFLQNENQLLLASLLGAMSGTTGLQHEHPRVRSRCCYLLLRLIKSTVSKLRPFVETAVTGIQALLSNPNLELRPEDTLYLFEAIGLLLGKAGLDASDQHCYLNAVLTPHVRSIEQILTKMPDLQRDAEHYGEILSGSIAAITHLSKGFANPADGVSALLTETLNITLVVVEALPSSTHVRNKSMVLLQRMILCVGKIVTPTVPMFLRLLVAHCTADDILFVSQIFNQLCIKFKDEAVPLMDASLVPFLHKCQGLAPKQDEVAGASDCVPPHLHTEQLTFQKLAFTVLQHVACHKATAILVSPRNKCHFETILKTMSDGAIHVDDLVAKKTCIRFFLTLVEQWSRPNGIDEDYRRGLLAFVSQSLITGVFQSLLVASFNARDANGARVVSEFGSLLFAVKSNSDPGGIYQQCVGNMLAAGHISTETSDALQQASSAEGIDSCLHQILRKSKTRGS